MAQVASEPTSVSGRVWIRQPGDEILGGEIEDSIRDTLHPRLPEFVGQGSQLSRLESTAETALKLMPQGLYCA